MELSLEASCHTRDVWSALGPGLSRLLGHRFCAQRRFRRAVPRRKAGALTSVVGVGSVPRLALEASAEVPLLLSFTTGRCGGKLQEGVWDCTQELMHTFAA